MRKLKIDVEIRKRIIITLLSIFLYHFGTFVPIFGVDSEVLFEAAKTNLSLSQLLNNTSGGSIVRFGLLSLGILPYINASIIVQVLTSAIPQLKTLQKEEGEIGRQKLNQLTRFLTIIGAIIQSINIISTIKPALFDLNLQLQFDIISTLITGSMISLWLSEIISEKGVGNGSSIFIVVNIISTLPEAFIENIKTNSISMAYIFGDILLFSIAIIGIIFLQETLRFVPIISSKELNNKTLTFENNAFIPFKINTAGILPVVIASTIVVFFSTFFNYLALNKFFPWFNIIPSYFLNLTVNLLLFFLIILSTPFYATIVLDPKDIAEDLKKTNTKILGVRPGEDTILYLEGLLFRINTVGGLALAFLILLPNVGELFLGVQSLKNFGITSLIILVGTILDTLQELRSISVSNQASEINLKIK